MLWLWRIGKESTCDTLTEKGGNNGLIMEGHASAWPGSTGGSFRISGCAYDEIHNECRLNIHAVPAASG